MFLLICDRHKKTTNRLLNSDPILHWICICIETFLPFRIILKSFSWFSLKASEDYRWKFQRIIFESFKVVGARLSSPLGEIQVAQLFYFLPRYINLSHNIKMEVLAMYPLLESPCSIVADKISAASYIINVYNLGKPSKRKIYGQADRKEREGAYLILVFTASTGGGGLFSSRRNFFPQRSRKVLF